MPLRFVPCNFYPRPPRGGRPDRVPARHAVRQISIHALREEGDDTALDDVNDALEFLSTPSARRATGDHLDARARLHISIHALREEGDCL